MNSYVCEADPRRPAQPSRSTTRLRNHAQMLRDTHHIVGGQMHTSRTLGRNDLGNLDPAHRLVVGRPVDLVAVR